MRQDRRCKTSPPLREAKGARSRIKIQYIEFLCDMRRRARKYATFAKRRWMRLYAKGSHKNYNILVNEILPLWDSLRMQKGQKNQTFATVAYAIKYVSTNSLLKKGSRL